MSHFGLICPPVAGHVNPLAAVGRALIRRGHRVTLFHVPDMEAKARAEGLGFAPLGGIDHPIGTLPETVQKLSRMQGLNALRFSVSCACSLANAILRDGPEVFTREKVDALLVDQNEPAGGSVAEHLNIPFVSVCTSLPLNREPAIPPPFVGWAWSDSWIARLRNRAGYAIADRLIAPIQDVLNSYRVRWSLPLVRTPDHTFSKRGTLAQMPQEFDFPRRNLPQHFHYLGPWFDAESSAGIAFPFERLNGRPLVYGSLGTLQSSGNNCFRIMAEACAGLNVQLVLATGRNSESDLTHLPGEPLVRDYVPQTDILSRAALTLTHGGMNTTLQSLHFGVPAIALPLTHDQPAIAARLARSGAGLAIPLRSLTAPRLRAAIETALQQTSIVRSRAKALQQHIAAAGGADRAAETAETLVFERRL